MTDKTYEVVYTCINCKTILHADVPYGESIPSLTYPIPEDSVLSQFHEENQNHLITICN